VAAVSRANMRHRVTVRRRGAGSVMVAPSCLACTGVRA
jgi:hypothetical protein